MGDAHFLRGLRRGALTDLGSLRAIVFDLDGTLVDSRRDLADSANELLAECGARQQSEEAIGRMVGDGAATLVARAFAASGHSMPPDALARFLAIYAGRLLVHTRPYDGIEALLASLQSRFALGVLTNKPIDSTRRILSGLDLADYFAPSLVAGGDGPHPRKPDPDGLIRLTRAMGVRTHDAMLVGDSIVDLMTARAAGAIACIARYGFGFDGFPPEAVSSADAVIDRPSDLERLL